MDEVIKPTIPEVSPTQVQPVQLNPRERERQEVNTVLQTAGSVLRQILSGIGRVVGEIAGLIFRQ